jgi:hypothetical protein
MIFVATLVLQSRYFWLERMNIRNFDLVGLSLVRLDSIVFVCYVFLKNEKTYYRIACIAFERMHMIIERELSKYHTI